MMVEQHGHYNPYRRHARYLKACTIAQRQTVKVNHSMTYPQKPKRTTDREPPFSQRQFYWELSKQLFKPALLLMLIFFLATVFIRQRDSVSVQRCAISVSADDGSVSVRIDADVDTTRYEWRHNEGRWQQIMQLESYGFPYGDPCEFVMIEQGYTIVMQQTSSSQVVGAVVKTDTRIERFRVDDCRNLSRLALNSMTDDIIQIQVDCDVTHFLEFSI